jgi:hypothetical protein
MAAAYTVLLVIAVMGVGLGWRLTPPRSDSAHPVGLPRLLQLGIAGTALLVMLLLLVPWLSGLDQATCTTEDLATGNCVAGLRQQAIFGSAVFAWMVGAGLAFVLRKGVIDYALVELDEDAEDETESAPVTKSKVEPKAAPEPAKTEPAPAKTEPAKTEPAPAKAEPEPAKTEPEPAKTEPAASEPEPAASEPAASEPPAASEAEDEPEPRVREPSGIAPWRRLSGPVFSAFVDDRMATPHEAVVTAAKRLRSDRVAAVFSRGASKEANLALLELAEELRAYRYVLEGTAAATEGVPTAAKPDPHEADHIAGPEARHAGELALDLAGALIETVVLIDTRVAFPEFVLGKLTELQSVCVAHAHDAVSGACQVLLPGTNPGEVEGELEPAEGETNDRRPRKWWLQQIVTALREQATEAAEAPASTPSEG